MYWLSCRELATELQRNVLSELDERGVKLYYVSIGTAERGREFVEKTGFPADRLLADPDSQTYEAMNWTNSFWRTLFSIQTPLSLLRRLRENGLKVLKEVLSNWKPWIPPQGKQVCSLLIVLYVTEMSFRFHTAFYAVRFRAASVATIYTM